MITLLKNKYPEITFQPSDKYSWVAEKKIITFIKNDTNKLKHHSLLHELAHALLDHEYFKNDINLLKLERDAWAYAKRLLSEYKIEVNIDHIEDCMDTYRDWIHKRATCPQCAHVGYQSSKNSYDCLFCVVTWNVSESRLCMVKRYLSDPNKV